MTRIFLLATMLAAMLLPLHGVAQTSIYRSVDANGNVVFTDTPPVGGKSSEPMEVQRTNITPPPAMTAQPPASTEPASTDAKASKVIITQPTNETTIGPDQSEFYVAATATPELKDSELLQLYIDAAPHGLPQKSASWTLIAPERGPHDLTVHIVDREGKSITESEPVRVYVLRSSAVAREQQTQSAPGEAGTWEPPADTDWSKYGQPGSDGTWQGRPRFR